MEKTLLNIYQIIKIIKSYIPFVILIFILKKKNVKALKFNYFDNKNFNKIIKFNPDYLFLFAWSGIPNFTKKNSQLNYTSTIRFIKKIKKTLSLKSIIYTGTCWEILKTKQNKKNIFFVKSKIKIKNQLFKIFKKTSTNIIWTRLFYVYGEEQKKNSLIPYLFKSLKNNKKPLINNLQNKNDYINVADVVKIFKKIMNYKKVNNVIDFRTKNFYSVKSIYEFIKNLIKKNNFNNKNSKLHKNLDYLIPITENITYKCSIKFSKGIKLYSKKVINDNH